MFANSVCTVGYLGRQYQPPRHPHRRRRHLYPLTGYRDQHSSLDRPTRTPREGRKTGNIADTHKRKIKVRNQDLNIGSE